MLRSDNGKEYKSREMTKLCRNRGIVQHLTAAYTPQLNGIAERMNRNFVKCAWRIIEHAGLSKRYWGEAVLTATFLCNRCLIRVINHEKSPHEMWSKKKSLKIKNLKFFGCHACVHFPPEKCSKLDPRAVLCRFLGC